MKAQPNKCRTSLAAACCALLLCSPDVQATTDMPTTAFTLLGFDATTGHAVVQYDYYGGADDRQTRELRLIHRETGKVVHKAVLFNVEGDRARPSRKAKRAFLAKIKLDKGRVLKLRGKRAKGGELEAGRYWYRGVLKGGEVTVEVVLKGKIPTLPEDPDWSKAGRHAAKIRRMVTVTRGKTARLLLQDRMIKLTPGATMNDGGAWGYIGAVLIGGRISSDGRTYALRFRTPDPSDLGGPAANDEPVVIAMEHEAAQANTLGMRWLKRRKIKRATAAFERAFALHPKNKHAAYNLACMRARAKDAAAAVKLLRAVHKHHPNGLAAQLAKDKDFNAIRKDPRFATFVKTLK